MASRMSNRDRIQRMAQEADAAKKEKAAAAKAKPKKKATPKKTATKKAATKKKTAAKKPAPKKAAAKKKAASRKKVAAKARVKIVWAVCVPAGKALKIFPFREKAEAQAEAEKLTAKKGTLHVVRSERQPMEDDE